MNPWLLIVFLGAGTTQTIEWVKELAVWTPVSLGRQTKMFVQLGTVSILTWLFSPGGASWDAVFFLGVAATAGFLHAVWSTAQALKDEARLVVLQRTASQGGVGRRR